MNDQESPKAQALVILPFASVALAEQFAQLVQSQHPDSHAPVVSRGTAYEWADEDGQRGQVIEFYSASHWEAFVHQDDPGHHILQRITSEPDPE